jgi:hypothetical protein
MYFAKLMYQNPKTLKNEKTELTFIIRSVEQSRVSG